MPDAAHVSEPVYREAPGGVRYRQLVNASDVDAAMLKLAEDCFESWFPGAELGQRIDWEEFWDKFEKYLPADWEISELDNPALRKIKRHIREMVDRG